MPRLTADARRALVRERQQQILQAAAAVFAEKGFAHATIRDIARAAGVSEGSIYLYFKNKQDLLVHLPRTFIQPPVNAFRDLALTADPSTVSPDKLLRFVAENIVNIITHNRELVQVLFTSLPTMDAETRNTYLREGPGYALEMLQTYIHTQQAAGNFRGDIDPAIAARTLPGMMMFFLLIQEVFQPAAFERFEYSRVIPNVVSIFLHGIMSPSSPVPPVESNTTRETGPHSTARKNKSAGAKTKRKSISAD